MEVSGFGTSFDEDAFREAIRNTMLMAMPETEVERAVFKWTDQKTFTYEDAEGEPLDWYATPITNVTNDDVEIPVAMEFSARRSLSGSTNVGEFDNPRATLTVLDIDFALVDGADKVEIDGSTYFVDFVEPPVGLFGVTIYTIHISAVDEH